MNSATSPELAFSPCPRPTTIRENATSASSRARPLLLFVLVGCLISLVAIETAARTAGVDATKLTPYLNTGQGKRAREALRAKHYRQAVTALQRYLRRSRAHRPQARFLLAYALLRAKRHERAAKLFRQLVRSYPLLADYHRYYAAFALYRAKRFSQALTLTAKVGHGTGIHLDTLLLRADCLRALNRLDAAATVWREYLKRLPGGRRHDEAHFRIAEALVAQASRVHKADRRPLLERAFTHYKQVPIKTPLSPLAGTAGRRATSLSKQVFGSANPAKLTGEQLYRQSLVFFRKMRNQKAERGFARALQVGGLSPHLACRACYYRAKSVFKQRQRDRAAPLFEQCLLRCKSSGDSEMVVKSLYNLGRGLTRKGDYSAGIARFQQIEDEHPQNSHADDARLRAAEAYDEIGREDRAKELLVSLPKRYPNGDMAREAPWRLALKAYTASEFDAALRQLDHIISLGPARRYYEEGRAVYWKARILERQRKTTAARVLYERCIREYPLSYYTLLSFNRLFERHRPLYKRLRRLLIAPAGRRPGQWRFGPSVLKPSPAFRRGTELARLGFPASASRELVRAGLSIRKGQQPERLWLAAVVYDRANLWHLSHQVPRSQHRRYRHEYPLAGNYRRWAIAYPRAFPQLVASLSRKAGISTKLAWAIMREESAFRPEVESYANAIGLMQLILPTARTAGSRHGIAVDRAALRDPATNITLGTSYLAFLMRAFDRVTPLAIAGYNGGHGAVYGWLKRFGHHKLDEFIERIPYVQTRRYTKRVLATYFAYHVLYERVAARRIPRIGQKLPRVDRPRFGKRKKKGRKRRKR